MIIWYSYKSIFCQKVHVYLMWLPSLRAMEERKNSIIRQSSNNHFKFVWLSIKSNSRNLMDINNNYYQIINLRIQHLLMPHGLCNPSCVPPIVLFVNEGGQRAHKSFDTKIKNLEISINSFKRKRNQRDGLTLFTCSLLIMEYWPLDCPGQSLMISCNVYS